MFQLKERVRKIDENDKTVLKNVTGAFLIKGVSLIFSLAVMPSYIRFFNNDVVLGLWFTIISVLNWILNLDIGIGNGLRNRLVESLANKDMDKVKKYISTAYSSIGLISLIVVVVFSISFNFLNWNGILNISSSYISERNLQIAIGIVFIGIIGQFFLGLITSILYALQLSAINNLISLIRSILLIIALNIVPNYNQDFSLVLMAIINLILTLLPLLIVTIIIFNTKLKLCKPRISFFDITCVREILSLGFLFLFAQILYTIIMTNEYFITLFAANEDVVEYQIYYKPFSMLSTLLTLTLTPIWSAVTKAYYEKNVFWIKKLYKKLILIALLLTLVEFFMIPLLQIFIDIWLGGEAIYVNYFYSVSFVVLFAFMNLNSVFSSLVNGMGKIKLQVICFLIGALLKIPLCFCLVEIFQSWIGVVWANIFSLLIYCVVQPLFMKKYINSITSEPKKF